MKHGRAIIPEPSEQFGFVADPDGDGKLSQFSKRIGRRCFVPSAIKALLRNGVVVSERASLDAEGRAWLSWALKEFRCVGDRRWAEPMTRALVARTLRPTTKQEVEDAATDKSSTSSED